jgi:transcriptional regulator with XRE-family HTH domain
LSRTALAYKVDRSHAAVEYWETGRSRPRPEFVWRIAAVLGCATEELYEPDAATTEGGAGTVGGTAAPGDSHVAA